MSKWADEVELRRESDKVRAYKTKGDKREISIPDPPGPNTDIDEWLAFMSLDALEAARQFYWDRWTWEEAATEYRDLVALLESAIEERATQVALSPHQRAMAQQQGTTTLDLTHLHQMQDRRNG